MSGEGRQVQLVTPEQLLAKVAQFSKGAYVGYDAVFDPINGRLLIKGKHPQLVGREDVMAIDAASLLMVVGQILPSYIVPILTGQLQLHKPPTLKDS
jgi:hypothetical protein